ncbi:MAG: putative lipid II flippase FtsW [Verrucomicrobiota bacterium]|jgi:cell division protein FtsW|nr:putative lipid II flippase FtsW [Verrucomicrobiota bacterium]MDP6251130.1 putative lipid II flippase FtsW [Verrucomicrobiota bacterium]MDP7176755.1 putative lipid II flippase FtsW [Verrucomicrobiota bacterium]MDP7292170.1 putative lipid II flippase FtsW [Verrucomicrobiota bacterium]MDP7440149.1 putative lipid II flippase FtsW [Verrucomicrobiota bacterium]
MKLASTTLVFVVSALLALGLVMLYSATMFHRSGGFLGSQLLWCCIGLVVCLGAAMADYQLLKKISAPALVLALLLLVAVMLPGIGLERNGARRWLQLPGTTFQPSEFAKLAVIIALAHYCERKGRRMGTFRYGLLIPGLVLALFLGLIFIEPDWGATALLATVCGLMLFLAGTKLRFMVPPVIVLGVAGSFLLSQNTVRLNRIMSWLDPEGTKQGVGYQTWQSLIALGSGGTTGLGLGNGRQKLGFVPEHHTDFIFSVIGEELGLVATMGIVVAFVLFVICGAFIAIRSRDFFGFLLASGMTLLIGLQAFINIGVVTSTLPNKGLPLPFISRGGTNLVVMLFCVGVLLSVARFASREGQVKTAGANDPGGYSPFRAKT